MPVARTLPDLTLTLASAAVSTADLSVTITGLPSDTLLYGWLAQWV